MKLPWSRRGSKHRLALRASAELFAFVLSDEDRGHDKGQVLPRILRWGSLHRGEDTPEDFARRIRGLGLHAGEVIALLEPDQYQVLKVDTPNVPNEELKAAARWQIKEMVDAHLDDLTLDVMHVGGDQPRALRHLFVVCARNAALREIVGTAAAADHELGVIDIWESALRNLQCAQAASEGIGERATAALLLYGNHGMLTISAGEELYYTRRMEGDGRLMARALGAPAPKLETKPMPGFEYNPGDELGNDDEESPLIVELQRSIDVWERSWPDLPLARLYVASAEHGEAVATLLQRQLGLRSMAIDVTARLAEADTAPATDAAALADCLPLLGASLRSETRKL